MMATSGAPSVSSSGRKFLPIEGATPTLEKKFAERRRLVTGVNWSAAIINPFRTLGETGRSLDSMLERLRCGMDEEVVIVMHLATPLAEFTDRGKSAIVMTEM